MGRGIFAGLIWGGLLSTAVLSVASLMGEVLGQIPPEAVVDGVPGQAASDLSREADPEALAATQDATGRTAASQVAAPGAAESAELTDGALAPAPVPQAGAAGALGEAPATVSGGAVAIGPDDPVLPNPQAMAPEAPTQEAATAISTDPAAPLELPAAEPEAPVAEAPEQDPESDEDTQLALVAPETADPAAPAPEAAPEPEPEPEAELADGEGTAEVTVEAAPETEAEPAPDTATQGTQAPEQPQADTPEEEAGEAVATLPGQSVTGFGNRAANVTVNRLPSISAAPEAPPEDTETPAVASALRPVEAFAAPWQAEDDRPLFSIVLIDEADQGLGLTALKSFGYPLTFAVPAGRADATEAMARYRAAGHEVLLIAGFPTGAQPTDIAVAMEGYLQAVPEAVGVLDGTGNGFRGDRRLAGQVVEILVDSGHGLLTYAQGLNTARQLAVRDGVPVATIFRDLDSENQDAAVVRRFLDQAAFRAEQEDGVVLLGRLRAETISALLIWGQQDRAARVAIAPVSQLLSGQSQ